MVFNLFSWQKNTRWYNDDVRFVLRQHTGRRVSLLGHIMLIPSQPIFGLCSYSLMLRAELRNSMYCLSFETQLGIEPALYHTLAKLVNHHTTDAVNNTSILSLRFSCRDMIYSTHLCFTMRSSNMHFLSLLACYFQLLQH